MTSELFWLTLTAILAASLWIPYIIGVNTSGEDVMNEKRSRDFTRPSDPSQERPWVHRAFRAHLNLLEQFLPFAAVVIVAHLAGISTTATVWACIVFFWLRVIHAVWMIAGFPVIPARPLIFTAGWVCILVIAGVVLAAQ